MPRDRELYLHDILTAISQIESFTANMTRESFNVDPLVSAAVERKFEIIGEALKQLETYFPGSTSSFPKAKSAIGMRDRLAHGYFATDLGILWAAIEGELPPLKAAATKELPYICQPSQES